MFHTEKFSIRLKYVLISLVSIVLFNIYLVNLLSTGKEIENAARRKSDLSDHYGNAEQYMHNTTLAAEIAIKTALNGVNGFVNNLKLKNYQYSTYHDITSSIIWLTAAQWIGEKITSQESYLLKKVLLAMEKTEIVGADILTKGSQLKVLLTYKGGQKAVFKPKWYDRDYIIKGKIYAGKDRHNGEIASFHLARLLGLNRAPIVTGRIVNLLTEILPVSTFELSRTFYKNGNNTCFYGVCLYCKPSEGVCANGVWLEGSITLWLPNKFKLIKTRHPWQRTYTSGPATWELYTDYCVVIRKSKIYSDESRLLDLTETAVFDFLIGNGDRHHYEFFQEKSSKVLLIDNGKSFGNPYMDHIDALAPLYQCCRLILLHGKLSRILEKELESSPIAPVLTKEHLKALDRRLNLALAAIMICFNEKGSFAFANNI